MIQAQMKSVQCLSPSGFHRMAYKEWGDPNNSKVLVCVHGVTRVSDDFDNLARQLSAVYRVVCPDIVGRGRSSRLDNPMLYSLPQYVGDIVTLLARVLANSTSQTVDWLGTSMGGLVGIGLASLPDSPIQKLILNDIGPTLELAAIERIGKYIGREVRFQSFDEAAKYIREISLPFGVHTEEEWRKLAADVLRQDIDGTWIRHYDLALALPFQSITEESAKAAEAALWAAYNAIKCPTLLLRGAESDLLSRRTAETMSLRAKAKLVEIPGVGHAPTFTHADQIALVEEFLRG